MTRLIIDAARCVGHGQCYQVAPDLIDDDERGYGGVKGNGLVSAGQEAAALLAVKVCPEAAVARVEEDAARPKTP
jgi:ferredoxin